MVANSRGANLHLVKTGAVTLTESFDETLFKLGHFLLKTAPTKLA